MTRSQDFRVVFMNVFQVTVAPTEVHITCGIQHNPGTDDVAMEAQVGIATTHESAKLLQALLALLVAEHEDQIGREVAFDPKKLEGLRDQINATRAATGRKPLPPA